MREVASLGLDAFDIRWVTTVSRVAVNSAHACFPPAMSHAVSITIGSNCGVNRERFETLASAADFELLHTHLEDM